MKNAESNGMLSKPFKDENSDYKGNKNVEDMSESTQNNIVTSLAEKAMSVAGPVVPTKEDGEVDQERFYSLDFSACSTCLRLDVVFHSWEVAYFFSDCLGLWQC